LALLAASAQAGDGYRLTVLHANDFESDLLHAGVGVEDFGGAHRFASRLVELRAAAYDEPGARGLLTLSSGDNFLAGPEFSASLDRGVPFYDSVALQFFAFDAKAIGNHEFDFGPDVFADFIRGFYPSLRLLPDGSVPTLSDQGPTFLSANLDVSGEPRLQAFAAAGVIRGSTIVVKGDERFGIVGATTPGLGSISSPRFVDVDPDVRGRVQAEIDALTADGVNKIILISHLQSIFEDLALIGELRGVDIAVAGGGDELLANPDDLLVPGDEDEVFGSYPEIATDADGREVVVVTTSGSYRYVGRLIVDFDPDGEVISVDDRSGPVRVAGGDEPDAVSPNSFLATRVVEPVQAHVDDLAAVVIGETEVVLDGLRSHVRTEETNQGNLCADALRWQATELADAFGVPVPDVALQNGGGIRNDSEIPVGAMTELTTFDMLPFANFVAVVPGISASQFKEILENAVSQVEFTAGRFAQVSGFSFVYDPTGTAQEVDDEGQVLVAGGRVREVVLDDGTVLVSDGALEPGAPAITVATIDFLARGGDQYPFRGADFDAIGVTYQQALRSYVVDGLDGVVTSTDYPEGGSGRIESIGSPAPVRPEIASSASTLEVQVTGRGVRFAYVLAAPGHARLTIHDVTGREIRSLVDGPTESGLLEVAWDGRNRWGARAANGVYFGRLETAAGIETAKITLVR
jgi:5'-nucleotidase